MIDHEVMPESRVDGNGFSGMLRYRSILRRYPVISVMVLLSVLVSAIFAHWLAPYDPLLPVLSNRLMAPDSTFILGTDSMGRDVLSRLIYGSRTTGIVVSLSLLVGTGSGLILGLVAGYFGDVVDAVVSRLIDMFLAFPGLFFGLLFAATFGPSVLTLVAAMSIVLWAGTARIIRAETLATKNREYIDSAIVSGASRTRIIFRHLLPNVIPTFVVILSLTVGGVILGEAALSFLGAGVPLPSSSWGSMITEGQRFLERAWWIAIPPGMAITLTVLAVNLFGDWMRDYLDPKLRQI
jgi:peptide/nickel transport system permease protein